MHRSNHRVLCTIAGIDPTGGAGRDVDLAVFRAFGARGTAVVTADTVQDAGGVRAVHPRPAAAVEADLARILAAEAPAALKTGMLATAPIVAAVGAALAGAAPTSTPRAALVVDPVLAAGAGGALLEEDAIAALRTHLAPHATLLTPNRPEAARLLGVPAIADAAEAARALRDAGWAAVLVKDGHGSGPEVVDVLADADGIRRYARPRSPGGTIRGTGCALAAAITAQLGLGHDLRGSVQIAGDWLWTRIGAAHAAGRETLGLRAGTLPSREAQE